MTILPIEYINKSFGFMEKIACSYKKLSLLAQNRILLHMKTALVLQA